MFAPAYNDQGSEGRSNSEADDIFLFQILISYQNYHINWGNLGYITFFFVGGGRSPEPKWIGDIAGLALLDPPLILYNRMLNKLGYISAHSHSPRWIH